MVNVSKYLTNQIRGIDNSANGFDDWMIDHFNILSTNFFDEYNSRPYQEFAMEPIVTLAALTTSPKVKLAGLKLIEQILATQAVQTNRMRRYSPLEGSLATKKLRSLTMVMVRLEWLPYLREPTRVL